MRRALALFALLVGAALAAPAQTKGADARIAGLVATLGDAASATARTNAYLALLREKPPAALPLLVEALPRYDMQGQEYGLWLLNAYPIEESRGALQKLALDRSPLLEAGAALQLWRQGDKAELERVVKVFARKEVPTDVRRSLLRRAFLVREPRLSAAVRGWLAPDADTQLLEDALYHLVQVEDPEARAKVVELAQAAGLAAGARAACAAFLLALGEDVQGAALVEAIAQGDGDTFARLQRFLLRAPRLPEPLAAAVARIAEEPAAAANAPYAIAVLALHAGAKELPVLERLVGSPNLTLAKAALEALQKRGAGLPREALLRMLGSSEPQRALAAAEALRRCDDDSGFARVLEILRAGGADKDEAVRALAKFRRRASVAPLVEALLDPDAGVRSAAEQGLGALLANLFPYRRFDLAAGGYQAQGAPEPRAAAVGKLRAWCAANLKP